MKKVFTIALIALFATCSSKQSPGIQTEIAQLSKARMYKETDELYHSVSYHIDHGDGLDCYKVGETLGRRTAELMQDDVIFYPCGWEEYEILENEPLRCTIKLVYNPIVVGKDSIIGTCTISLTKGS